MQNISRLRVRLGEATVQAQCTSMLGRLETLGPGTAASRGRRRYAALEERQWGQAGQEGRAGKPIDPALANWTK